METTSPQQNKMDKLIEILNSMRNNSSDVDAKLTTFMEEAQNSTNSEEMLGEIVRTIYQKAVSDRSFASRPPSSATRWRSSWWRGPSSAACCSTCCR